MIDDHVFRIAHVGGSATGGQGGIAAGMCGWLGTCNRPAEEHAARRTFRPKVDADTRSRIAADYAAGARTAELCARYHVSTGAVSYFVREAGGTMRPRTERRTRS